MEFQLRQKTSNNLLRWWCECWQDNTLPTCETATEFFQSRQKWTHSQLRQQLRHVVHCLHLRGKRIGSEKRQRHESIRIRSTQYVSKCESLLTKYLQLATTTTRATAASATHFVAATNVWQNLFCLFVGLSMSVG